MALRLSTRAALAAALLLAACGEAAAPPAQPPQAEPPPAPQPPEAAAEIKPGEGLPPASSANRFVGRWAAAETACGHAAWRFTATDLNTAGEVSCKFDRLTRTAAGYDIEATCIAQAPPEKSVIRLTFAESAKAMMVEGGPFSGPVGLIYCGAP